MHRRMLRKQSFDELARQFAARSAPRNSAPKSAKTPGTLSNPPNERTRALEPNVGTLLYLSSLGVVAIATVAVFFGVGLFLLTHPDEELIAAARDRGVEVAPQHADLVSPLNKVPAPFPAQTASAPSVPPGPTPETHEVSPRASKDTALGSASAADTGAANAISDASSSQDHPGLRSNADEAALATPIEVPRAKRTGMGRHRHAGARKHWARISQPGANSRPPPAISGPERAWHWIVQSATGILAALSPPPSWQAPVLRTR
jgi:type IV secretory pathway VirB10-like protein